MGETLTSFIFLWVLLIVVIRQANRSQRYDKVDDVNMNILQTRQDMRLACHLLGYICIVLVFTLSFLVWKLG
jgi:hypothetical protein